MSNFHFAYSNHLSNWLEKMAQICEVKRNIKTWENLDYKLQTKELFTIAKGLSNRGLNPKTWIISAHVTCRHHGGVWIVQHFQNRKSKFGSKHKLEVIVLVLIVLWPLQCSQLWVLFVVCQRLHCLKEGFKSNWVKLATFTTRKKFKREVIAKWKLAHGVESWSHNGSGMEGWLFLEIIMSSFKAERLQRKSLPL